MAQHLGRRGVPQDMCAFGWAHDTRPLHHAFHHGRYAIASLEWPIRRNVSNKDMVAVVIGIPACEVVQDRVANVLRERQANLIPAFPGDAQRAGLPLDIADAEPCDVAGPEPKSSQKQDDRSITPACR